MEYIFTFFHTINNKVLNYFVYLQSLNLVYNIEGKMSYIKLILTIK